MKKENKQNLQVAFLDFDDIKNPYLGAGQAKATYEVGKRLTSKGNKVLVISSRFPGYKNRTYKGITYKHIGLGTHNIRLNNLFYILSLPFAVRGLKSDIVVECFTAPVSTMLSPLWTKIPVVALPSCFDAQRFANVYKIPFHLIEKMGIKYYKYFLPYTQEMEKKVKKANPDVVTNIIPEGVGEEFFKIKRETAQYILFLGRLDMNQKGIDLLLKAYAKITSRVPYPLVIAGNGPDEEKIKKLIKKLNLENQVKLIGPTFGRKKELVISRAAFIAFSSRSEGFSLFALEAFAAGLPMVAFDIPGFSWVNEPFVDKAKAYNVNQYSRKLLKMSKKANNKKLSQRARNYARKYTWNSVANKFEYFFNKVLKIEKKQAIN